MWVLKPFLYSLWLKQISFFRINSNKMHSKITCIKTIQWDALISDQTKQWETKNRLQTDSGHCLCKCFIALYLLACLKFTEILQGLSWSNLGQNDFFSCWSHSETSDCVFGDTSSTYNPVSAFPSAQHRPATEINAWNGLQWAHAYINLKSRSSSNETLQNESVAESLASQLSRDQREENGDPAVL